MPVAFYIIPVVVGPYNRDNRQRPQYVDEIRCNWTGCPVDGLEVYLAKVNTSEAKHLDLASRSGVRQLPRSADWETPISSLPTAASIVISNWLSNKNLPFDSSDTIGDLLGRILSSGLFSLGAASLTTQYQALMSTQRDIILHYCEKCGLTKPEDKETVSQLGRRLGKLIWPGNDDKKVWVREF